MHRLYAGAGKRCVNLPGEMLPYPSFVEGVEYEGTLGDLFVRALALDNGTARFLILSFDCGQADEELKKQIAGQFGLEQDHIMAVSTHNHSSPQWGVPDDSDLARHSEEKRQKMEKYGAFVEGRILEAAADAFSTLRPARYGFGEGKSYINVNRDQQFEDGNWMQSQNHEGPSDKTLAVMKFEDVEGRLIGAVLNYGCHGTCAFCAPDTDGEVKASPEFMGYACSYVEQRFGDRSVVLWTSGAAGDQNPLFSSEGFPRIYEADGYSESIDTPPGTQYMIQRHHGWTHAIDAIRILKEIKCRDGGMRIETAETVVNLQGQTAPEGTDMMMVWHMADNFMRKYHSELCINGKPPKKEMVKMLPSGEVPLKMQLALLGDVAWVQAAGELYAEIGMKLKKESPWKHTVVVTHTEAESAGYILSDNAAGHNVFQSYNRVHPGNNDRPVTEGMQRMFRDILG